VQTSIAEMLFKVLALEWITYRHQPSYNEGQNIEREQTCTAEALRAIDHMTRV